MSGAVSSASQLYHVLLGSQSEITSSIRKNLMVKAEGL